SGDHCRSNCSRPVCVTRIASPPLSVPVANTSPCATKAIFLPSRDTAISVTFVTVSCVTLGAPGAPSSVMATAAAFPLPVFIFQIPKSRSNTTSFPRAPIVGHSTRPLANRVSALGAAASGASSHRFSAPLRSDMKYSVLPSAPHIGHRFLPPPLVNIRVYWFFPPGVLAGITRQISVSSLCACPFRHHCADASPRAAKASEPSSAGAAKNSLTYRSLVTASGVPPPIRTRYTSFMPPMLWLVDEKYTHWLSGENPSNASVPSSQVSLRSCALARSNR